MKRTRWLGWLALLAAGTLLAACQRATPPVAFHATQDPADLAAWHVVDVRDGYLVPNQGVVPYGVNAKLFSDYAFKLRTVWMPKGTSAKYTAKGPLDFPVGTIISKTFYYPLPKGQPRNATDVALTYTDPGAFEPGKGLKLARVHLIETRLLLHRKAGWQAITYTWNAEQTHATLAPTGALDSLVLVDQGQRQPFHYVVPSHAQCAICHDYTHSATINNSDHTIVPIGPTAAHLNRDFTYATGSANQLEHWAQVGYLTGVPALASVPRDADWLDTKLPLEARARSYLDANCAYCHNPHGEANYTSLWLTADEPEGMHTGFCKTPVAAGRATGNRLFDIVPGQPDASIVIHRMASTQVGVMMPELGRTLADRKAVELISDWIKSLPGNCTIVHGTNTAP